MGASEASLNSTLRHTQQFHRNEVDLISIAAVKSFEPKNPVIVSDPSISVFRFSSLFDGVNFFTKSRIEDICARAVLCHKQRGCFG